jgi:hypothetical protein
MKKLMLVAIVVVSLAISASVQGASLILFSDLGRTATNAVVPVGGTYNIELFLQGDESDLGPAVEFRLVSSSADVQFLEAVWSNEIVLTLGDIVNGISLTSYRCLGYDDYGYGRNVVHIGTIRVSNIADADTFTVRVAGISDFDPLGTNCDAAFSAISIPGNEFLFNGVDTTHPTIRRIEPLSDTLLRVTFSEPMYPGALNDIDNFSVYETINPQAVVALSKVECHDQFTAKLSLASPLVVGVSYTVWVSSAQDLAFNSIDQHSISFTMSDIMPPEVVAANIVDDEMLEIIFNEPMNTLSAENTANYRLSGVDFELAIASAQLLQDMMTVHLTLSSAMESGESYGLHIANVTDLAGNSLIAGSVSVDMPDVTPPTLVIAYTPVDSIVEVTFSERLNGQSAENAGNYELFESANPSSRLSISIADLLGGGTIVRLSLLSAMIHGSSYTLRVNNVQDSHMNEIIPNSEIAFTYYDLTPPVLTSFDALSWQLLEVQFSEALDSVTAVNAANYFVFETENQVNGPDVVSAHLTNEKTVRLTMGSSFQAAVSYTIAVSNVRDIAGNQIVDGRRVKILIPLAITHEPISCGVPGSDVSASWSATDPVFSVASTCLYYRRTGAASWIEQCESNPINPVVMTIPGADMGDEGGEYYITATNGIGLTVYHGSADIPHFVPACPPVPCERPIISLLGYHSIEYANPIWRVNVEVFNSGPGAARNVIATMNTDVSWLIIPDPVCSYGDIPEGNSDLGGTDSYTFDLINNPGGSFNVWFDVTYEDSCGNQYHVRLDPEFGVDGEHVGTPGVITAYHLGQNYPNPFNPITTIDYQIPIRSRVSLKIFDVSGKLVRTLVDEYEGAGSHDALWDGKDSFGKTVASSIYFYELRAGSYRETKRMVLLR